MNQNSRMVEQTYSSKGKDFMIEDSFKDQRSMQRSSNQCLFCASKGLIMKQLGVLKGVIEQKNQKIKDLQQFIQRLSQMMLSDDGKSTEKFQQDSFQNPHQKQIKQFLSSSSFKQQFSSKGSKQSSTSKAEIDSNMLIEGQCDRISIGSSSKLSNVRSDRYEGENVQYQLKREIRKMDLNQMIQKGQKRVINKALGLRKKVTEIMKVVPSNSSISSLHNFSSASEQPMDQGVASTINTKSPQFKMAKSSAFKASQMVYTSISDFLSVNTGSR